MSQRKKSAAADFDGWLEHYREVTGRTGVKGSKAARAAYAARREEGRSDADLRHATIGAHSDPWMREQGYDVPDTILRASKVERYIVIGQRHAAAARKAQPSTGLPSDEPGFTDAQAAEGAERWDVARRTLEGRLNPVAFTNYVEPVQPRGFLDGVLWVQVPEPHVANRIRAGYAEVICVAAGAQRLEITVG